MKQYQGLAFNYNYVYKLEDQRKEPTSEFSQSFVTATTSGGFGREGGLIIVMHVKKEGLFCGLNGCTMMCRM